MPHLTILQNDMPKHDSSTSTAHLISPAKSFTVHISSSKESEEKEIEIKALQLKVHFYYIEKKSRWFLGLERETYGLIKIVEQCSEIFYRDILIILKKIRL